MAATSKPEGFMGEMASQIGSPMLERMAVVIPMPITVPIIRPTKPRISPSDNINIKSTPYFTMLVLSIMQPSNKGPVL
jgi:hypothetical protein